MEKIKLVAHMVVCNEERWVWFAIMSVIDYVDEILVWDTGSTDNTVKIIKSIKNKKIKFRQMGKVDAVSFTAVRQKMLEITKADWLLLVDGDEVWPDSAIQEAVEIMTEDKDKYEFSVRGYYNLLGDIYHYQEPSGGQYKIGLYFGHFSIRGVNLRLIPGLHFAKPHGQQGLFDENNTLIQDRRPFRGRKTKEKYFHFTHLNRSINKNKDEEVVKRRNKFKYELGIAFTSDFAYPRVFYLPRPNFVPNPWTSRNWWYLLMATWQTPLKILKRKLLPIVGSGY